METSSVESHPFPWQRAVVVGMARSGRAVCGLLARHGVRVLGTDLRTAEELNLDAWAANVEGVELVLGEQPHSVLDDAQVLIPSPGIPKTAPLLREALSRSIPLLSELEVASLAAQAPMAVVTGTNGKSTVVNMLGRILEAHGRPVVVAGNVGIALSEVVETVPAHGTLVVEASSYQLEDIDTFHPRVSCVLNITPDHLNRYRGMDHYASTKWRVVENQTADDFLVLPAGHSGVVPPPGHKPRHITFGFDEDPWEPPAATVSETKLVWHDSAAQEILQWSDFPLLGRHNRLNAAAAVALVRGLGLDPGTPETKIALEQLLPLPHRMETVAEIQGVRFIDDSKATNPESLEVALDALEGPLILVAGGQAKSSDYKALAPLLGPPKTQGVALIGEAQEQLAKDWAGAGVTLFQAGADFKGAVFWAWKQALKTSGTVLLSPGCASFDMFEDFEHRGNTFRKLVLELMEEVR